MATIRIVRRPLGEAPEWVRDAWLGVELDLVTGNRTWRTFGVLSGPRSWFGELWRLVTNQTATGRGYAVVARTAVERLAEHAPEAAEWWRSNVGHMLDGKRLFVFDSDACALIA